MTGTRTGGFPLGFTVRGGWFRSVASRFAESLESFGLAGIVPVPFVAHALRHDHHLSDRDM